MKRRDFLKTSGLLAAQVIGNSMIVTPALLRRAEAATELPLASLRGRLKSNEALVLIPSDPQFLKYQAACNLRTALKPQVRVVCASPQAVSTAIQWARANQVPFATRSGGHSYEGFSQSTGLVIDTRLMKTINVSADRKSVQVGAGCALGEVYSALSAYNLAIPAGSCPTVGVAGHTLGGGYGLLSRAFGLACDGVENFEMVDASGTILNLSETENTDLFWACRGGGQGSFGIITQIRFRTHLVSNVNIFGLSWVLPVERAVKVMKAWQSWAPNAPDWVTSLFHVTAIQSGMISLHCAGQSLASEGQIVAELSRLESVDQMVRPVKITTLPFIKAIQYFGGGSAYPTMQMKGKSDYLFAPMSDQGILTLMNGLKSIPPGSVAALCDSYGGAINRIPNSATAFAHRENAQYSIQYYSEWRNAADNASHLAHSRDLYTQMRPYVSGAAYVNYCDLDLRDWAEAYWGMNLPRLKMIKSVVDPTNFFKHAQSIPLPKG